MGWSLDQLNHQRLDAPRQLVRRACQKAGLPFVDALIAHRLAGSPVPPHHDVKVFWLAYFQRRYGLKTLVETGTYLGQTVESLSHWFEAVYSIELDPDLFEAASRRFEGRANVHLVLGDSTAALPDLLEHMWCPCLFWLDGHYSGPGTAHGTVASPIRAELDAISSHGRDDHVILVDDARLFDGSDGYLELPDLRRKLLAINPHYRITVLDDIVVAQPRGAHE